MKKSEYLSKLISIIYKQHQNLLPFLEILRNDIAGIDFLDLGEDDTAYICAVDKKFYIKINNKYIMEYKFNDEDILWLICHEISHFVLDHHNSKLREIHSHQYCNFAFDCQVNSMLHNINRRKRISFFDKNYAVDYKYFLSGEDRTGFYFLLMPPKKTDEEVTRDFNYLDYDRDKLSIIKQFWFRKYSSSGLSTEEINEYLEKILPEDTLSEALENEQNIENDLPESLMGLREIIEEIEKSQLNENASIFFTGLFNNDFGTKKIDQKKRKQDILRAAMKSAFFENKQNNGSGISDVVMQSIFPSLHRKEAAMLGSGMIPVFYSSCSETPQPETIAIFIDFSVSTRDYHSEICALLASVRDVFKGNYYAFTTELNEITYDQLIAGKFESGGTDIGPVIEHINTKKFKKVLIITDGEFSSVPVVTKAEIYLLLFEKSNKPDSINKSGRVKKIWFLQN